MMYIALEKNTEEILILPALLFLFPGWVWNGNIDIRIACDCTLHVAWIRDNVATLLLATEILWLLVSLVDQLKPSLALQFG